MGQSSLPGAEPWAALLALAGVVATMRLDGPADADN